MFVLPGDPPQFAHEQVRRPVAIEVCDDQGVRIKQVIAQNLHLP
ncbi:MAG: hypothetical protein OXP68_09575 [Anaerolineaceae bacterium]|nr:hypothetical protein [Anaerolineaceae bacterium]MDE0329633.1 hypothetical protein [Anaerolineaceae bacterium]